MERSTAGLTGIGLIATLGAWLLASPAASQSADSLAVTLVNETGEELTEVTVFFVEAENLLSRPLADGDSIEVRVESDGCLFHVFGENGSTKRAFRRYAVDVCRESRVTLTPEDRFPDGEARDEADLAALMDVYCARAPKNFDGVVDLAVPPDDDEYDLRFYFDSDRIGDSYFLRREDGRFALRLEMRWCDDRAEARSVVAETCRWLAQVSLASGPLRAAVADDGESCVLRAEPPAENDPELRVAMQGLPYPDGRYVVFVEIPGGKASP